jgi:hypothetical protein
MVKIRNMCDNLKSFLNTAISCKVITAKASTYTRLKIPVLKEVIYASLKLIMEQTVPLNIS